MLHAYLTQLGFKLREFTKDARRQTRSWTLGAKVKLPIKFRPNATKLNWMHPSSGQGVAVGAASESHISGSAALPGRIHREALTIYTVEAQ